MLKTILLKAILLSAVLISCGATLCKAAVMPLPLTEGASPIIRIAEGCGDQRWRDEYGHCHWFKNPYGTDRGTHHACPTWAHWYAGVCVHN